MVIKTYDPILEEGNYINKFFAEIPVPKSGTEIILYATSTGKKLFITKEPGIKPKDIHKGKYDRKIVIDMHSKPVSFREEYQSRDAGVNFNIEVNASVKVTEADVVWENDIHDVAQILEREMSPKISDAAAMYSLDDVRVLQQDLRNILGDFFLADMGISIQGISYIVKLEEAHEQLLKIRSYERNRSKTAREISDMYQDDIVAVFADVADGSITPEEASERARKSLSSNFDERMRQLRAVRDYVEESRNKDLANHEQVLEQMDNLLKSLPFADSTGGQRSLNHKEEYGKIGQSSEYAPMDD